MGNCFGSPLPAVQPPLHVRVVLRRPEGRGRSEAYCSFTVPRMHFAPIQDGPVVVYAVQVWERDVQADGAFSWRHRPEFDSHISATAVHDGNVSGGVPLNGLTAEEGTFRVRVSAETASTSAFSTPSAEFNTRTMSSTISEREVRLDQRSLYDDDDARQDAGAGRGGHAGQAVA
jgi:hypothetical protein